MKTWMLIFSILMVLGISALGTDPRDVQQEKLFGTDAAPLATTTISAGQTVTTRTIKFKNPHKMNGMLFIFGYAKKTVGTADTIFVDFRMLNDRFDNNYDDWITNVATLVPGDSLSYRINDDDITGWDYCDGYQLQYRGAAGSFTYTIQAVGKSR